MKTIFYTLFILSFLKFNFLYASIQTKIIGNVGSQIITSYELKNKIVTTLMLSNQSLSQVNVDKNKNLALLSLINYKLKKNEILKFKVTSNQEAVDNHLKNISSRFSTNINGLKKIFLTNNIDFELYIDQIETEYAWQKLIYQMYKDKIIIDDFQINEELNIVIKQEQGLEEYEIAEIEILLNDENDKDKKIKEIQNEISLNGFENTAIKYSTSASSIDGGKLGWISVKSLSTNIAKKLKKLDVGDVTSPILKTNSILFLKLLNKKKTIVNEKNLQDLKDKITINKKNELFNLYSNSYLTKVRNNTFVNMK